jgi:hypothetical protein
MPDNGQQPNTATTALLQKFVTILNNLPWIEMARDVWQIAQKIIQRQSSEGMYEVLDYETTLELHDKKGIRATLKKRERIRYLQDNVIAYQDQAWGDGEILLGYRCVPGKPVDRYRSGYKTHILISRREVKNRGDIDEYRILWGIRRGFLKSTGFWETEVSHRTYRILVQVIFPKGRQPYKAYIEERNQRRCHSLGEGAMAEMPDGRWQITWEQSQPRLYEHYVLNW